MKKFKTLFVALIVTAIFSGFVASAASYSVVYIAEVKLGSYSGVKSTDIKTKSNSGNQYVKTTTAKDDITGGGRAISVKTSTTNGKESAWISAPLNSLVTWSSSEANGNTETGPYTLSVKATRSTFAKTIYAGTWYIDSAGY